MGIPGQVIRNGNPEVLSWFGDSQVMVMHKLSSHEDSIIFFIQPVFCTFQIKEVIWGDPELKSAGGNVSGNRQEYD